MATRRALEPVVLLLVAVGGGCRSEYPPPPPTTTVDVVDTIHGEAFSDPYRWLEAQDSAETRSWIDAQNAYAETIVGETALRQELRTRLRELMDFDRASSPRAGGDIELFTLRREGEEVAAIYRRVAPPKGSLIPIDPGQDYERVLHPSEVRELPATNLDVLDVSPDGSMLLYSVRDGGQDEIEVRLRDLENGADLADTLPLALYSSVMFDADGTGFYYSRRSRVTGARIYFHRLGDAVDDDEVVFPTGEPFGPRSFVRADAIADGRYLLVTVQHGWAKSDLHLVDVDDRSVTPIVTGEDARFYASYAADRLYVRTNLDAPNNRLFALELSAPERRHWTEVVPESDDVLHAFAIIDDALYVTYLEDVSSRIDVFALDGTPAGELAVPAHHRVSIRGATDGKAFLSVESFLRPRITYLVDLETGEREIWDQDEIPFDPAGMVVEQIRYPSKDGTSVPMYLVRREDAAPSPEMPALLTGYGGFNVANQPQFDVMGALWVERGGLFALANIRGGSEYGETWHRAGMLENKQNVFDDFIAAGEWLVESGMTSPARLAIRGASNGGLLVASALTQRPELFRAVLCGFPDLDMVRFYTFTETNNMPALLEYGDAEKPEQFAFVRKYSPYQAVRDDVAYPAVMLTSGDLDTRVPPHQARKMAARLQAASASGLPVVLRYHPKAGHAARRGVPLSQNIEDRAAEMSFLLSQLGVGGEGDE